MGVQKQSFHQSGDSAFSSSVKFAWSLFDWAGDKSIKIQSKRSKFTLIGYTSGE